MCVFKAAAQNYMSSLIDKIAEKCRGWKGDITVKRNDMKKSRKHKQTNVLNDN